MAKLKVASLFCGCGGMDLGVLGGFSFLNKEYSENPFEIVYSIDNDEYCTKIYNANFEHKCIIKDVREIKIDELPQFDMLIGGFPCQSFSISAQNPPRLGYKDERGMLFFEMVKILKEKKPRFFIAENVKGIMSANKGQAFPMIISEFKDAGYSVTFKLLNASDYGVPQKRERVIIVGFRDKEDYDKFRYPSPINVEDRKVLGDVIIETENQNEGLFFSQRAVDGMMAVREKMNKGRAQRLDEPCNTVSAHLAKVSLNSTDPVFMVGERFRRFSTREAARIQSFPDDFALDSVSQIRQYKAIGNAVPPVLMWHVIQSIKQVIDSKLTKKITKVAVVEPDLFANIDELCDKIITEVDFNSIKTTYPEVIVDNNQTQDVAIDEGKNVLISLVKADNVEHYLDRSARVYYTGKKFPSTVALNKLFYFMPYVKKKGIRDLYLIKIARVGTKKEGQPDNDPNDFRLVFEIEFLVQLYPDYRMIDLEIWHTFTDTTINELLSKVTQDK